MNRTTTTLLAAAWRACVQTGAPGRRWQRGVLLAGCQLVALGAWAQQQKVTGRVTDRDEGLPGVTIQVKGGTGGATSNADGSYSLTTDKNATLVFSYVGYQTQEIALNGRKSVDVKLLEAAQELSEVEVVGVGYGEVRKADATGAIGSVNVDDLQKAPVTSFEQALGGRVAGLQVAATDGQPGDALNINIRGNSSVNNSNSPLYVIDGFPIEDPNNNAINPQDIASIDVLKDASATAIYGSRGANGVIIITTKRGKKGAPVFNYNAYAGFNKVTRKLDVLNAYEFVKLQQEISPTAAAAYFTNGRTLEGYRDVEGVDYQAQAFRVAPFQNHYLSVSGGTDLTRYNLSGSVTDQQGILVNSGFRRYQGRLVLDQQLSTRLKLGLNINFASTRSLGTIPREQSNSNLGGNTPDYNLVYSLLAYRPVASSGDQSSLENFTDPDQQANSLSNIVNPLFSAQNEYNARFNSILTPNLYLNYNITKDLVARVQAGANLNSGRVEIFNNSNTRSGSTRTSQGQNYGVNGSLTNTQINDYSQENALTYTKAFRKDQVLTALAVYSMQYNTSQISGLSSIRIPNESLGIAGLDEGTVSAISSGASSFALQSFTGRLNYALFNKYVITGTLRADGSSKFAPGNRWGYFPSAAVAWKLKQESFMQDIKAISTAKVRASFGVVGNNRVGDFAYLSQITNRPVSGSGYPFGGTVATGFAETLLGNPNLKWETTRSFDAGLEIGFLQERISLEADVYIKETRDLLLNAALPTSAGFANNVVNVGRTQNKGLELTLNTLNVQNEQFTWTTNLNVSFNRNQLLELASGQDNIQTLTGSGQPATNYNLYIARVGDPISQFYSYVFDGIYQYSDFNQLPNGSYVLKDGLPYLGTVTGASSTRAIGTVPGDPKYKDLNGDGVIDAQDLTIIGNPFPKSIGGFTNNFTFKGFDLSVFFQWSYGNDVFNANRYYLEGGSPVGLGVNQLASYANRWTPDNPSNSIPRTGGINSATNANVNGTRTFSSRFLEDGSFLRLKTVQIGYNLPTLYARAVGLKSARVYVSAQNLKVWTKYTGYDPEVNTKGTGLTAGYDFSPYPRALVVTGGINVTL